MLEQIQSLNMSQGEMAALKLRKLRLKQARVELLRRFGLLSYKPHAKQDKFHAAGSFRRRMVRAGNRFGKSLMGCAEDISWALGHRPWYPDGDVRRTVGIPQGRPTKGLIITTDFDVVDEVWTSQRRTPPGKIWQLIPPDFVKRAERNSSGTIDHLYCQNGSSITWNTCKSWQNDPQSLESTDWDWIHVDEPCPQDMWKAASRGLIDRDGYAWFTLTPLREVWINDMFFPRRYKESPDKEVQKGNKWAIQGTIYDNPYLSKDAIAEYADSLTNDEKQCRLFGLPLELSGLIYKEFDYDRHVLSQVPKEWKDYNLPPDNYCLYYAIDPHPQTPHAVLFCAVSPFGQKFFWSEIFEHTVISNLSRMIHNRIDLRNVRVALCDPLAYIKDPITDTTIASEFEKNGIFFDKATKDLSTGILKVKEELTKENNLYFSPRLEETLWEFERYMWDEKENKPMDKDDHMMENLYRILLCEPRWVDRAAMTNIAVDDVEVGNEYQDDYSYLNDRKL
jgi:hypothetical protein